MQINSDEIQQQSMAAWNQWRDLWVKNAKLNSEVNKRSFFELLHKGKGKKLLQCAFGYSLKENLEDIKLNRGMYDIYCCDKAFGLLKDNGITPEYCHVADAQVSADWIGKHDTSKTILIANIAANPAWTLEWKGPIYFYTNWDNIATADILGKIGNCFDVIPASSNVSNSQVVFASQVLDYDKQFLIGFDYSWEDDGAYYAGPGTCANNKQYYMHHATVITSFGNLAKTSTNLIFSCKWLLSYILKFSKQKIINCSERGILTIPEMMSFREALLI